MNNQKVVFFFLRLLDGGGVSTHCADLAHTLQLNNYSIIFIYGGESTAFKGEDWFKKQGFTIFHVPFTKTNTIKSFLKNLSSYSMFVSLLYKYRPAIIHCHFRSTAIFAMISKALTKTKSILTVHLNNMPSTTVTRFFQSKFDKYIAISSEIEDELIHMNIKPDKIDKIYNGVDNNRYTFPNPTRKAELRLRYGFHPDKLILVVVARLAKVKAIDILIKAIAELSPDCLDQIQCVIVGDGPSKQKLSELTDQLGLQNFIYFAGYRNPVDYYALGDVFVSPSYKEGFSIAIVEAMLSGLAILRTPTSGCYDQVIENQNGFIFPFDDYKMLAEKIELLAGDTAKLRDMQKNSYALARSRFTLKVMTGHTVEAYSQLVSH